MSLLVLITTVKTQGTGLIQNPGPYSRRLGVRGLGWDASLDRAPGWLQGVFTTRQIGQAPEAQARES